MIPKEIVQLPQGYRGLDKKLIYTAVTSAVYKTISRTPQTFLWKPSLHLACDVSAALEDCPVLISVWPGCRGRRRPCDFRTDLRATYPQRFFIKKLYTIFKTREPVDVSQQALHYPCPGFVWSFTQRIIGLSWRPQTTATKLPLAHRSVPVIVQISCSDR